MATWDATSFSSFQGSGSEALRRVHIIDDLLGAVLLLAAAALAIALELTRRQICAVYQLAFALCVSWLFFIVGGLVDHHVSDSQLSLALFGSYHSVASYVYAPVAVACSVSLAFVLQLSWCSGCECCCIAGGSLSSSSHKPCFDGRVRSHVSLYIACFVSLFVAVGTRLNVRLRGSAINPMGGTLHWTMLRSPCFVSVIHVSTLLLIALKLFLQHADKHPEDGESLRRFQRLPRKTSLLDQSSLKTSIEDAMRPVKKVGHRSKLLPINREPDASLRQQNATAPRRSLEAKSALTRSPSLPSSSSSSSSTATEAKETFADASVGQHRSDAPRRGQIHKRAASSQSLLLDNSNDGDVSALISSDSENDEEILLPSFKTTGPTAHLPPIHQQHQRQQPRSAKTPHKSTSRSSSSGYSSSPPASPVSTVSSSSSSAFSFSSMGSAPTLARQQQQQQQQQRVARTLSSRPRSSSSISSTSTANLMSFSDTEDLTATTMTVGVDYYSDRPSSASSSIGSYGIRRRAAAQVLTLHHPPPPPPAVAATRTADQWLECFDAASGSVYFYNQHTGESRWERPSIDGRSPPPADHSRFL